jgi:hypothetical protein
MAVYLDANRMPLLRACVPAEGTRVQMIKVFLAYADRHPEKLHQDFADVAIDSLGDAFPCK